MFVQHYVHPVQSCNCSSRKMIQYPDRYITTRTPPPIMQCTCSGNNYKLKHTGCRLHKVPDETGVMPKYCLPRCPCGQTEHYEHTEEVVVCSVPLGQPLSAEVMVGKATCSLCGGTEIKKGKYSRALDETHCEFCHMTYEGYPLILWFTFTKRVK